MESSNLEFVLGGPLDIFSWFVLLYGMCLVSSIMTILNNMVAKVLSIIVDILLVSGMFVIAYNTKNEVAIAGTILLLFILAKDVSIYEKTRSKKWHTK